ncbi:hypothetical protein GGI42DRAFT_149438 [Trichoderma sp. SZMC 28013]
MIHARRLGGILWQNTYWLGIWIPLAQFIHGTVGRTRGLYQAGMPPYMNGNSNRRCIHELRRFQSHGNLSIQNLPSVSLSIYMKPSDHV